MMKMLLRRGCSSPSTSRMFSGGAGGGGRAAAVLATACRRKTTRLATTTPIFRGLLYTTNKKRGGNDSGWMARSGGRRHALTSVPATNGAHQLRHGAQQRMASSCPGATTTAGVAAAVVVAPPTRDQLTRYFWTCSLPFLAYGFMDQTIMIHAGHVIDCTLAVHLGLSTLTAAACGEIVSSGCSALFSDTVDRVARAAGLPSSGLSRLQRNLPVARRVRLAGTFLGVVTGASLALINLWLVDTGHAAKLKELRAIKDGGRDLGYEIDVTNRRRKDATVITVRGPDVDGLLATITATLHQHGVTFVECNASPRNGNSIEDVFVVQRRNSNKKKGGTAVARENRETTNNGGGGGSSNDDNGNDDGDNPPEQLLDEELDDLAVTLLQSCKDPFKAYTLRNRVDSLEDDKKVLQDRIRLLEQNLRERDHINGSSTTIQATSGANRGRKKTEAN